MVLADACEELRALVDHLGIPVAHSLMGKGALPDDHPLLLGMSGFWGTKLVNDTCLAADWVLGLGTRFKEADCSSWYRDYTFNIPPTRLIHIDIEPARDRQKLRHRDRGHRRSEAGAAGPQRGGARDVSGTSQAGKDRRHDREIPSRIRGEQPGHGDVGRIPDDARAHPRRSARAVAARRDHHHRRWLEQEWRRPAVSGVHARQRADARWIRNDGLRSARGHRREDRRARSSGAFAGRRWRIRPEPLRARDRGRAGSRDHLAGHEQQCLRDHRRAAEGGVWTHSRHVVSGGDRPAGTRRSPTMRRSPAPMDAKASG